MAIRSVIPLSLLLVVGSTLAQDPDGQPSCEGRLTPATRRRDPLRPYIGRRPAVVDDRLCFSDPRYNTSERLFVVDVLVQNEKCEPLQGVAVEVEQADTRGVERPDCGGRFVTDENGRIQFSTVRPRFYDDAEFNARPRPRTIQFRVRSDECNDELITQFYLKKDRRRTTDPCPASLCHSNNEGLFFYSVKRQGADDRALRINSATITVRKTCSEVRPALTEAPTTVGTTLPPTTIPPTPCPNPQPSPWDAVGPFYEPNQPARKSLCLNDPNYNIAIKTELTVHLRDQYCNDLAGFPIDFWHTNYNGQYVTYCRSLMTTNSSGMFTVTTIKPGIYPGRPRHIHYIVHSNRVPGNCYNRFTTQSYWPDRFDNRRLIKECTSMYDGENRKTGEKCLFTITLRNPGRCPRS